ncbi:unnamed protein product [Adineta steineri]|uniref:Uncharacterized protein n=1 Tax=Adineta steineri TaxID=433720 RepID=A0A819ZZ63_9BILA|nr:unnamed protein product [Adineta steineri]
MKFIYPEILLFDFDSRIQQHAVPFCISPSTIFSKIFHNDIDWQSIASEEYHNANEVFDNNNEEQPDPNVFSFRKSQSPSCSSRTSSITTISDKENEEKENSFSSFRTHTILKIAVLLSLFRHHHSLSKSCITDMCHLLRLLGVKNVPSDLLALLMSYTFERQLTNNDQIADIVDGFGYERIRVLDKTPFITMVLNSDGIFVRNNITVIMDSQHDNQ